MKSFDFNKEVFSILKGSPGQLEWGLFENRIREIVIEVLEPQVDKAKAHMMETERNNTDIQYLKRRLESIGGFLSDVKR